MFRLGKRASKRNQKGMSTAEFGPSCLLLFMGFFFPLLDLIAISVNYGSGDLLNSIQLREAARIPASEANSASGYVKLIIPSEWQELGVGKFVNLTSPVATNVSYLNGQTDSNGIQDKIVVVTTSFAAKPFLTAPGLPGIPGLTAPLVLSFTSQSLLENPSYATE